MYKLNLSWYDNYKIAFRNKADILARDVCRYFFKQIIDKSNSSFRFPCSITIPTENFIDNGQITTLTGTELLSKQIRDCNIQDITITLIEENPEHNGEHSYSYSGGFFVYTTKIQITVNINSKNFKKADYNDMYMSIYTGLRHEIEHAVFQNKKPEYEMKNFPADYSEELKETVLQNTAYLLEETEMEAYIRKFMAEAKRLKIPISRIISESLKTFLFTPSKLLDGNNALNNPDNKFNVIRDNYNSLVSQYVARAKEIYPKYR